MTRNCVVEQILIPNLRKMSRKICASPVEFPDEPKVLVMSFCSISVPILLLFTLLNWKPVLQGSNRGKS